jgi:hypothetical protein
MLCCITGMESHASSSAELCLAESLEVKARENIGLRVIGKVGEGCSVIKGWSVEVLVNMTRLSWVRRSLCSR